MIIPLLGIPILGLAVILQTSIISRLNLAYGSADIILLILISWSIQEKVKHSYEWLAIAILLVGFVTKVPFYSIAGGYIITFLISRFVGKRIWQIPMLLMVLMSFLGTMITLLASWVGLTIAGTPLPFLESMFSIVFPSLVLNILLCIPVYLVFRDLAGTLYPVKVE